MSWENVSYEDVYYSCLDSIDELKPLLAKIMAVTASDSRLDIVPETNQKHQLVSRLCSHTPGAKRITKFLVHLFGSGRAARP